MHEILRIHQGSDKVTIEIGDKTLNGEDLREINQELNLKLGLIGLLEQYGKPHEKLAWLEEEPATTSEGLRLVRHNSNDWSVEDQDGLLMVKAAETDLLLHHLFYMLYLHQPISIVALQEAMQKERQRNQSAHSKLPI